jgi:hypothetical protein
MSDDNNEQAIPEFDKSGWREEFIFWGGFEQLSQVFQSSVSLENLLDRKIISSILPTINLYLSAAMTGNQFPSNYKCQYYCRSVHYSLKYIQDDLNDVFQTEEQKKNDFFSRPKEPEEFLLLV